MTRGSKRMIGGKTPPAPENAYGTDAEIAGRDGFAPTWTPTTFRQIGPEDSGKDLQHPAPGPTLSDNVKFSRFRG